MTKTRKFPPLAGGEEKVGGDGGRVGEQARRPLRQVGVDRGDAVLLRKIRVEKVSIRYQMFSSNCKKLFIDSY